MSIFHVSPCFHSATFTFHGDITIPCLSLMVTGEYLQVAMITFSMYYCCDFTFEGSEEDVTRNSMNYLTDVSKSKKYHPRQRSSGFIINRETIKSRDNSISGTFTVKC